MTMPAAAWRGLETPSSTHADGAISAFFAVGMRPNLHCASAAEDAAVTMAASIMALNKEAAFIIFPPE